MAIVRGNGRAKGDDAAPTVVVLGVEGLTSVGTGSWVKA
jgi:hypothetical protein